MKHVTYISAGAGSGKTYTLTAILADLIINKGIKPEEFILTTFTEAAAREFRAKAKERIYSHTEFKNYAQIADRLEQAQIGTIDSVANSFLKKYWYILGISPSLKVINDKQKKLFISQILKNIASQEEIDFLKNFCEEFAIQKNINESSFGLDYDFWKKDVKDIFEKAKSYNVLEFSNSVSESIKFANEICGDKDLTIDLPLINTLIDHIESVNINKPSQERTRAIPKYRYIFNKDKKIKLNDLKSFKKFIDDLPSRGDFAAIPELAPVKNMLSNIATSKQAKDLILKYIKLIFKFSERAIDQFDQLKVKNHLIDYVDMENYFNKLLTIPEVQSEIRSSYRYVFVDEFQDSSPVQVEIFDRLSEIIGRDSDDNQIVKVKENEFKIHNSIWVGDFKQAIYSFRGADTDLTKAVADIIKSQEKTSSQYALQTLDTSYRSVKELVNFSNYIFTEAFNDILTPEEIRLKAYRSQPLKLKSLKCWPGTVTGRSVSPKMEEIAKKICTRLNKGEKACDYAVLARNNNNLIKLAEELNKLGIPVRRSLEVNKNNDVFNLIAALLNLVININDDYSRTVIAFLSEENFGVDKIIESRIAFNQQMKNYLEEKADEEKVKRPEYLENNELIKLIIKKLSVYQTYTIHNLVESLIIDLNLVNLVKNWKNNQGAEDTLQAILESTSDYESLCSELGLTPTISSFIDFAEENIETSGSEEGVTLYTFHSSKGLEWKKVILIDLDDDPDKKIISYDILGVQKFHKEKPCIENLMPAMIINLFPRVFNGNIPDDMKEKIEASSRYKEVCKNSESELKRLLYVAITRARDELILAPMAKASLKRGESSDQLLLLNKLGSNYKDLIDSSMQELNLFENPEYTFKVENIIPDEDIAYTNKANKILDFAKEKICKKENKFIQPSKYTVNHFLIPELLCSTDYKIQLEEERAESSEVGTCIHDIFCIMETNPDEEKVKSIIKAFGLEKKIKNISSIFKCWQSFTEQLTKLYGKAESTCHETPFSYYDGDHIITGSIDFIWRTKDETILVDFKTFPGDISDTLKEGNHYAGNYSGQFICYENVLKANGEKVKSKIVFYPVGGTLVELKNKSQP